MVPYHHYNLTYYAETAMVIDATIDLRIKSMTGPFRLYFEQQMQHKGPIIQVENVMALQRGSWFLTDGNAMPLTDDDIEPVLNQDYYFYCGEHLDCSNTSIEYDSLDSVGFTEDTAISKSFCKKVEGLGTCSGFQFIDVFSHIALDLCYYETDPALCSEYNYTISKDDVGSLNDKCVFPGTHKLSIHVAEDMSDGAAFDFDDITKSAFKLRVEFNSTDGQAKKVNVKFSDKTPSVISRMRLDHTIINFESKTTSKDLLIEGLEWGEDVQFASGSLLNPDSPKEIDIPFCAFGKSNIDAFSEVRIASEEEYEIEYIDDGWSLASAKCSGMQYVRTEKSPNMYMWSGIFPSPFTVSVTMSSNVTRPVPMHFRHGNANGKESHDQTTIFSFSREMENYTGIPIVISDAFNGTKTQVYGYYVPVLAPYANDFRVWQRRGMRNEVRVPYQQYHSNSLWVTNTIEDAFSTSFDGVNFTQRKARMYAYNTNHEERICSLKSFDCTKDAELTFESLRLNGDFALSSGQKVFLDYVSFANTTITLNIDLNAKSNHVIEQLLDARLPTSAVPNQVLINIDGSQAESSNISIVIITSPIANEWLSISTINTLSDDWNASLLVTNTSLIVTATRTTPSKHDKRTKMIIGISVAAVSAIVILVVVVLICRRRRHNPANIQATPLLKSMS